MTSTLTPHPTNPFGVLVPCANCGSDIHMPRSEATRESFDASRVTCSYACMRANEAK